MAAREPQDIFNTVINFSYYHARQMTNFLANKAPPAPASNLRGFSSLPPEIACQILSECDIGTLLAFRGVNRCSRELVLTMPDYRFAIDYVPGALGAILHTGTSGRLTFSQLREVACTENCSVCGSFGAFLSLMGLSRRCFTCLGGGLFLVSIPAELEAAGLEFCTEEWLQENQIPVIRTIPGRYGPEQLWSDRRLRLLHPQNLGLPGWALWKEEWMAAPYHGTSESQFMAATVLPAVNPRKLVPRPAALDPNALDPPAGFDSRASVPHGFEVQNGLVCLACEKKVSRVTINTGIYCPMYSREGFLKHFQQCRDAKQLWGV